MTSILTTLWRCSFSFAAQFPFQLHKYADVLYALYSSILCMDENLQSVASKITIFEKAKVLKSMKCDLAALISHNPSVYDHHLLHSISNGEQIINNRVFHINFLALLTSWECQPVYYKFPKTTPIFSSPSRFRHRQIFLSNCCPSGGVFSHALELMLQITYDRSNLGDIFLHTNWSEGYELN